MFDVPGQCYTTKYRAWGEARYSPHTDDCGYMAPFSVRVMPMASKSSNCASGNMALWSGSEG